MPPETVTQTLLSGSRQAFVLGLDAEAITSLRARVAEVHATLERRVPSYAQLGGEAVLRVLADPAAAESIRLDPNRLLPEQAARIPGLDAAAVDAFVAGRPYYSLEEVRRATGLDSEACEVLFALPPFQARDKAGERVRVFRPVPDQYLVAAREDLLSTEVAEAAAGYAEAGSLGAHLGLRLLAAVELESGEVPAPHRLKAAYGGAVHPVLEDEEGWRRIFVPRALDVWFQPEVDVARRREILEDVGLRERYSRTRVGYHNVELATAPADGDEVRAMLDAVTRAQDFEEVAFAEPDQAGLQDFGPSAAEEVDEWEAQGSSWNLDLVRVPEAHALTLGGERVTIFVVDSGARMDHAELAPGFRDDWPALDLNFDLGVPEAERSPEEAAHPHGTQVVGVARRVAPDCRILPVKIPAVSGGLGTPGYGLRAAAIREALGYLRPGERAVINLSWRTEGEHIGIRQALLDAMARDVAVVASAGNYPLGVAQRADAPHYPSGYVSRPPVMPALCSVGAVGPSGRRASYSYFGESSVTVYAPGGESTPPGARIVTTSTPAPFDSDAGTSFAAPHVAGVLALMFAEDPGLGAADAVAALRSTGRAFSLSDVPDGPLQGVLLDARAAVDFARGGVSGTRPAEDPDPEPLKVDLNSATKEELMRLPAVGEWRASAIVRYREEKGPFTSVWELCRTRAFDPFSVLQLMPHVTVGAA